MLYIFIYIGYKTLIFQKKLCAFVENNLICLCIYLFAHTCTQYTLSNMEYEIKKL